MGTRAAAEAGLDTDELLKVLAGFRAGDFSARLPEHWTGVAGRIADSLNDVIARNERFSHERARLEQGGGKEGRISQRISALGSARASAPATHSVNDLVDDLVRTPQRSARA